MTANPDLLRVLRRQAEGCRRFGSPFCGALMDLIAVDLEAGGPVAELLAPWADADYRSAFDAAVALRISNAFNHLAMSGEAAALSAVWPKRGRDWDIETVWTTVRAAVPDHFDALAAFMTHEPQTNEVRRSIALLGGFLAVAAETGLPRRCFEIGASAGLNLYWDLFHHEMGASSWGDPTSPVQLATDWSGSLPPLVPVQVIERAACDRRPTDLNDPAQRRRLLACIWPDQYDRLDRSRAAIDLALAQKVKVEQADALDWTRARVGPQVGAATVLYHSSFWFYLAPETQAGLRAEIERLGASASAEAPFALLSKEPSLSDQATDHVRLTLWPGGEERVLAESHPHGATMKWLGA